MAEHAETGWSGDAPQVKKAIRFIKQYEKLHKTVPPEVLVEWDEQNGKRLFDWNDTRAAHAYRLHQARLFFNRFGGIADLRVRSKLTGAASDPEREGWINLSPDAAAGITQRGYVSTETISQNPRMQEIVVDNIVRRMVTLARELQMWHLSAAQRKAIIRQIEEAMEAAA